MIVSINAWKADIFNSTQIYCAQTKPGQIALLWECVDKALLKQAAEWDHHPDIKLPTGLHPGPLMNPELVLLCELPDRDIIGQSDNLERVQHRISSVSSATGHGHTHTHFNTANAFFRRGSKSWLKTWTFSPSCMKPFQRLYCEIVTSEEQYSPRRIWDTAGLYDTGHDWSLPVLSLTLTSTWCKLPFNASPTKSADKIRSIVDYFHTDLIPHP